MKLRIAAVLAAVGVMLGATGCSTMNQEWHYNCKVLDKERVITDGSSGAKRLSTSCGPFDVSDNISSGFNSYDMWSRLEEGKAYDIKSGGYRVGFFSQFPNVLEIKESK